jgi:hypothetical protein
VPEKEVAMVATTVASDPNRGRRPLPAESLLIDQFMPTDDLAVVHSRVFRAPPEQCFETVVGFDLFQLRAFRVLIGARGLPQRLADALRRRADQTRAPTRPRFRLRDMPSMGWMLLGERPGAELVFGQVGKPGPAFAFTALEIVWQGFLGIYMTFWGFRSSSLLRGDAMATV